MVVQAARFTSKTPGVLRSGQTSVPVSSSASVSDRDRYLQQGYVERDGLLYSPEEEFFSSEGKSSKGPYKVTGKYNPYVLEFDSEGRLFKQSFFRPRVVEQSKGFINRNVVLQEVKTFDYSKNELLTARFDTRRKTSLVSEQLVMNEVKQGVRSPIPSVLRASKVSGGESMVSVSEASKSQSLRFGDVLKADVPVSKGFYQKYLSDVVQMSARTPDNPIISATITRSRGKNPDLYGKSTDKTKIEEISSKTSNTSIKKQITTGTKKFAEEFISPIKGLGKVIISESPINNFGKKNPLELTYFNKKTQNLLLTDQDVQATFATGGLIAGSAFIPSLGRVALAAGAGYGSFTATKGFIQGDIAEGTKGSLEVLTFGFLSRKSKAEQFLDFLRKERPSSLKFQTFFGEKQKTTLGKGDIIKTLEQDGRFVSKSTPQAFVVETKTVKTPEKIISLASGKNIKFQTLASGEQFTTIQGSGKFKNLFLKVKTSPEGYSKGSVFVQTGSKTFGRQGFKKLASFEGQNKQTSFLTEEISGGKVFDELRLEGLTIRSQQTALGGKILPASRKGFIPQGKFYSGIGENVIVAETVPRTKIQISDSKINVEVGKTEFNIVDFPVKYKTTSFKKQFIDEKNLFTAKKPTEFKTLAEFKFIQKGEINFEKFSKNKPFDLSQKVSEPVSFLSPKKSLKIKKISNKKSLSKQINSEKIESFSSENNFVSRNLEKYDPSGLSGDRLRLNSVIQNQGLETVNVVRPKIGLETKNLNAKLFLDIPTTKYVYKSKSLNSLRNLSYLKAKSQLNTISKNELRAVSNLKSLSKNTNILKNNLVSQLKIKNELKNRSRQNVRSKSLLKQKSLSKSYSSFNIKSSPLIIDLPSLKVPKIPVLNIPKRKDSVLKRKRYDINLYTGFRVFNVKENIFGKIKR